MHIAIIGDFNPDARSHIATNAALKHSADYLDISVSFQWISTDTIRQNFDDIIQKYHAFLIAPGGLYKDMDAVLEIIKYARLNNLPILGTCGGFQHMVIEYARNVLGINNAGHAEYDSDGADLVISPLSCNVKGSPLQIKITDKNSRVFRIYNANSISENYYCSFGINPSYQKRINDAGLEIVGSDDTQEARILEFKGHPFFIETLFVPQVNSSVETPNKMITAFLKAGMVFATTGYDKQ